LLQRASSRPSAGGLTLTRSATSDPASPRARCDATRCLLLRAARADVDVRAAKLAVRGCCGTRQREIVVSRRADGPPFRRSPESENLPKPTRPALACCEPGAAGGGHSSRLRSCMLASRLRERTTPQGLKLTTPPSDGEPAQTLEQRPARDASGSTSATSRYRSSDSGSSAHSTYSDRPQTPRPAAIRRNAGITYSSWLFPRLGEGKITARGCRRLG